MSNMQADPQQPVPGFWTRLALAIEAMGESESETDRLEKRVRRLEAEVERLSAIQKKPAKTE